MSAHDRFCKTRLLAGHMSAAAEIGRQSSRAMFALKTSHLDPTASAASTVALGDLNHVSVTEMRLSIRNLGCRIEGTVCCRPIRHTAIQVLLEDAKNAEHAIKVSAYNLLPASGPMAQVLTLLAPGTRLAIKEPYLKTYLDGSCGIRVDNPADLVFLESQADAVQSTHSPSLSHNRACGNKAFR